MAELPPIKKPPKQSSKGLGFFFSPTKGKKSRWKWVFENPTNCAATFGGLGFLFGATIEGGGLISSLIWGGVMGVLIYFIVRFLRGN